MADQSLKMSATVDVQESVNAEEVSAPAPAAATVTSVKSTIKKNATKSAPQNIKEAEPEPTPTSKSSVKTSSSTTSSSKKTVSSTKKTVQYQTDDILGDLSRNYRGTSPAVLEGIAHHPALFSRVYDPVNPRLSSKSKKIIRETADLALFSPGLKNLLEVEYTDFKYCWLQFCLFLFWLLMLCVRRWFYITCLKWFTKWMYYHITGKLCSCLHQYSEYLYAFIVDWGNCKQWDKIL